MDSRAIVDNLLGELGAKIDEPGLALKGNGTCSFDYMNEMKVVLELPKHSSLLYIYSPVMRIPKKGQKKLFRKILQLNLFCYETNGATFAISEDHEEVVLCYHHPVEELGQAEFETIFENFIATLERLHALVTGEVYVDDDEHAAAGDQAVPSHFIRA